MIGKRAMRRARPGVILLTSVLAMVLMAWALACGSSDPSAGPAPTTEPTTSPETDRQALVALYHATDGPNWSINTNWLSDAPLDQWYGVITDGTGRVMQLELASNGLSGELPPEIGNLSKLWFLRLGDNDLSGQLPSELGRLLDLLDLWLPGNQFSGQLPSELGRIGTLGSVWLEGNDFAGCAPDLLHDAARVPLDMPKCTVPDHATEREALVAFYNASTDGRHRERTPSWLSEQPVGEWEGVSTDSDGYVVRLDMSWLGLYSADWAGPLTPDLGSLSRLVVLDFEDSQTGGHLTGEIPRELGNLTNMRVLHIGFNFASGGLSGEIPSELGNLSNLTRLSLGANQLTGEIPSEVID